MDTYETCHCTTNTTLGWDTPEEMADVLSSSEVRSLLQTWYSYAYMKGPFGSLYLETYTDDSTGSEYYMPKQGNPDSEKYMSTENVEKLELLLFKTIIFGGTTGVMASGASANDPLFWVFHQVFDKAVQALRLSPKYNMLNMTWNNVVEGAGDRWEKATVAELDEGLHATPFKAEIFEWFLGGRKDANEYLTNKELWALLKPDSNSLSYVYDDFTSWGSCSFDPLG